MTHTLSAAVRRAVARTRLTPATPWLLALLAGCAPLHPDRLHAGDGLSQVTAAMGEPTGRYALPGQATRLEYALGPRGKQTWMVDVDGAGQVVAVDQVLQPAQFSRVQPGMAADDLLRLLGRPAHRQREWQDKQTWSWRFDNPQCLWLRITLGADGRVIDGPAFPVDPACDPDDRGRGRD
jgi:hypothetical protein